MKKYIAIILAVVVIITMTFALSACKKDESADLKTKVVTNEAGEVVTDENGNQVTEKMNITEDIPDDKDDTDVVKPGPAASSDTTVSKKEKDSKKSSKKAGKTTTNSSGKPTAKTTTKKDTTTKKETTTAKPKKRKVSVTVNLPYYNNETHEMTVWYKVLGEDKEYTKLDPQDVVLNNTSVEVDLGKLKGDVRVVVKLNGMPNISDNKVTIKSNETHGQITIVTGIEMLDGGMD